MTFLPEAPSAELRANPQERVEAAFARIAATRMADVPICNPALRVEAVGFRRWQDEWVGVLVTPWAMNLMVLPGGGGSFRAIRVGDSQWWQFPSGAYEFFGNREEGLGAYQVCSLFSPVFEFEAQEVARETAHRALEALLRPAEEQTQGGQETDAREAARLSGASLAEQPVSRRGFLRSILARGRE